MPSSPRELLAAAHAILNIAYSDEAIRRAAASRCYYAGLHELQETFPPNRPRRDREGTHEYIIAQARQYAQDRASPGRAAASGAVQLLVDVKPLRVEVDYNVAAALPPTVVETIFMKVARIFELCAEVQRSQKS